MKKRVLETLFGQHPSLGLTTVRSASVQKVGSTKCLLFEDVFVDETQFIITSSFLGAAEAAAGVLGGECEYCAQGSNLFAVPPLFRLA